MTLRLLFVSNLYPPQVLGGYELSCARIAEGLRARGHEVRVLTTPTFLPTTDAAADHGVDVHRTLSLRTYFPLPATGGEIAQLMHHESSVGRFENTRILLDELRDFRPDHVVAFNLVGLGGIALLDLLGTVDAPWTLNLGDRVPNQLVDGIPREVLAVYGAEKPDWFASGNIVALTESLVESIEAGGLRLGEVETMARGVQTDGPVVERSYRRDGVTRFVFAGSISEHKGVGIILDAAAQVAETSREFTIDLFGSTPSAVPDAGADSDPELDVWRQRAADAGLADLVTFHGPVPQSSVVAANRASDAFLFPTWSGEPFGVAPVEAAAVGCVPILTQTSGVAEYLVDGNDCLKITRSVASLVDVMRRVVLGDVDLETIGMRGQRHTRAELGFDHSLDLIEANLSRVARAGWHARTLDDPAVEAGIMTKDRTAMDLLHRRFTDAGGPDGS